MTFIFSVKRLIFGLTTVYLKLVVSIAAGLVNARFPIDELISEGSHVLLRTMEKFDADRGLRFSTYATHAIRRSLYRHVKRVARQAVPTPPETLQAAPDERRWTLAHERRMWRAVEKIDEMLAALLLRAKWRGCTGAACVTVKRISGRGLKGLGTQHENLSPASLTPSATSVKTGSPPSTIDRHSRLRPWFGD